MENRNYIFKISLRFSKFPKIKPFEIFPLYNIIQQSDLLYSMSGLNFNKERCVRGYLKLLQACKTLPAISVQDLH